MPDINKFKSVSVSIKTDNTLEELSKTLFPVEVSKQKVFNEENNGLKHLEALNFLINLMNYLLVSKKRNL